MHAVVCLLRAGQVKPAGNAAESGQFVGEFSCDENVTPVLKGFGEVFIARNAIIKE